MSLTSKQKRILLIGGSLFFGFILLAVLFSRRQLPKKTLEIWGFNDSAEVFNQLTADFRKNYPNIYINYIQKNEDAFHDDLLKAFANNSAPDIIMAYGSWLPYYQSRIYPLDLNQEKELNLFYLNQNYPEIIKNDLISGHYLLGIPLSVDTLALFYNKDVFNYLNIALPPKTWEEITELVPKLRRINDYGQINRAAISLGANNVLWHNDILSALIYQLNGEIVDKSKKEFIWQNEVVFADRKIDPIETALNFYLNFSNPPSSSFTWSDDLEDSLSAFSKGKTVMAIGYFQDAKKIKNLNPNLSFDFASLPYFQNNPSKINYGRTVNLVVLKNSQHPQEAWLFLKFLSQEEVSKKYFLLTKNPPSRLDLIQNYLNDPASGVFVRQILTSRDWYQFNFKTINQVFDEMINQIVYKNKYVLDAVEDAANKLEFFWSQ